MLGYVDIAEVPAELILPRLKELWAYEGNMTDAVICEELNKVFDQSKYTLGQVEWLTTLIIN